MTPEAVKFITDWWTDFMVFLLIVTGLPAICGLLVITLNSLIRRLPK